MRINTVFVELSSLCNSACKSCPHSVYGRSDGGGAVFDRKREFMDMDLFRRTVREAWTVSNTVNFSFFGEQTLHPSFLECLDFLSKRPSGKRVVLFTSFLLITQQMMDMFVRMRLDNMRISLDAATSSTYDLVRPGGPCRRLDGSWASGDRFDAVTAKVEGWFRRKDHVPTRHEFTVSSKNVHEVKDFVQRWTPLLGRKDLLLTKSILTYGGVMLNDSFLNPYPCKLWGKERYLIVGANGIVSPCNLDVNLALSVGDITKQSLSAIIASDRYRDVERNSRQRTISPCRTCTDGNNRARDRKYRRGDVWHDKHLAPYKPKG